MKNILILGGTGFVGSQVCEQLVRNGWAVTVLTRRSTNARHIQHLPQVTVLEVDIHNDASLAQAIQGHAAVVNLVAILHGTQEAFEKVHVALPRRIAAACVASGVKHLVHISALGADARSPESAPSMYLRSKGQGEVALRRVVAQTDVRLTVLRPSVIFGAEDRFLNLFAKLQKTFPAMPLACATARFQPVWVEDVASAVVRCLELGRGLPQSGKVPALLEACGPDVLTLADLVRLSAQLSGANHGQGRPILALPAWAGRLQATIMEWAPGEPLMSRDNLDSMRLDNVASGEVPGLTTLGITPSALIPIAANYLARNHGSSGFLGLRKKAH